MDTKFTFRTVNDWFVCNANGTKIVMNQRGSISHLDPKRGKCRIGAMAEHWLRDHGEEFKILHEWLDARESALKKWKHETPHHRYDCDGGCLAVRVNGVKICVGNRIGDGNYPVYVIKESGIRDADTPAPDVIPHTFEPTGVYVESDDGLDLEVMDYDCSGANVLEKVRAKSVTFYRDWEGAVVVKYAEA